MNNRIKQIRKKLDMTQEDFASKLGLSRNFIAQLESGTKNPSNRTISDICQKYNVSESWLKIGEGEMFLPEEDEEAAYVSDLLFETDNELYDLIKSIMKTYSELGEKEKAVLKSFAIDLKDNLEKKNRD